MVEKKIESENARCPRCGAKMKSEYSKILDDIATHKCGNCGIRFHLFEKILQGYKKPVNLVIKKMLEKYLLRIDGISKLKNKDVEEFHWKLCTDYINRGGKYIRSTFLILTAEAIGCNRELCLNTAAAMEISENWLLIHDDFQDQSTSRRGAPTLHLRYSPGLAVNAGDSLHLVMWKILQENIKVIGQEKAYRVMEEFYKMLSRTALGQTAELFYIHLNKFDLKYEDIYYILDGKTSYYTIAGPMRLGAILAENNKEYLENKIFPRLNEFGKYLGRAFQIIDDILDLTTEFRGLKQQQGNDIYEGKRTVMLTHLLNAVTEFDRKRIIEILKKPRDAKTEEDIKYVLHMMKEYGSINYAKNLARDMASKAVKLFRNMDFFVNEDAKKKLLLGIDFVVNREF